MNFIIPKDESDRLARTWTLRAAFIEMMPKINLRNCIDKPIESYDTIAGISYGDMLGNVADAIARVKGIRPEDIDLEQLQKLLKLVISEIEDKISDIDVEDIAIEQADEHLCCDQCGEPLFQQVSKTECGMHVHAEGCLDAHMNECESALCRHEKRFNDACEAADLNSDR